MKPTTENVCHKTGDAINRSPERMPMLNQFSNARYLSGISALDERVKLGKCPSYLDHFELLHKYILDSQNRGAFGSRGGGEICVIAGWNAVTCCVAGYFAGFKTCVTGI